MMQLVKAGLTLAALWHHPAALAPNPPPIRYAGASWYEDGGETACGFHAGYGVASRTLACGTKVTLYYGGRRGVRALVDDRGPFVDESYRLWDLNQSVAGALGFSGVHTVGYRLGWW